MREFRSLCVYCGSRRGRNPAYAAAARELGERLGSSGIRVVYGGGKIGLMGLVADAALNAGGEVVGVIPEKLRDLEVAHEGLTSLEVVPDMHTRKFRMAELADGFVALPGGYGTLEELFEAITWTQLGYHRKPVGVLDVADYYRPLAAMLDHLAAEDFLRPGQRELVHIERDPAMLLQRMATAALP